MLDPKKLLDALIAASSEGTAPFRDPRLAQQKAGAGDILGRNAVGRSPGDENIAHSGGLEGGFGGSEIF